MMKSAASPEDRPLVLSSGEAAEQSVFPGDFFCLFLPRGQNRAGKFALLGLLGCDIINFIGNNSNGRDSEPSASVDKDRRAGRRSLPDMIMRCKGESP